MNDLKQRIGSLEDNDALEAVNYLAKWMQNDDLLSKKIPSEAIEIAKDDKLDKNALKDMLLDDIKYDISTSSNEGQIARNLLMVMAEENKYAPKVQEALDRPSLRLDPGTLLLYAAILFFLTIEFDYRQKSSNGKSEKSLRIVRKVTPSAAIALIDRIFGK
jgi:hypothetical protein